MAVAKINGSLSKHVATLRIIFGLIWAVDASFKWFPAFSSSFLDQIKGAADGQPHWLQPWFSFWVSFFSPHPHFYAYAIAIAETLIALALIFGFLRKIVYLAAAFFSLCIWAIPEGFGGPYSSTSTDIGTGIIYAIVFFSLYGLERMAYPSIWNIDILLISRFSWWKKLSQPKPR